MVCGAGCGDAGQQVSLGRGEHGPVRCQKPIRRVVAPVQGGPVVFVDDAAEDSSSPDRRVERDYDGGIVVGRGVGAGSGAGGAG